MNLSGMSETRTGSAATLRWSADGRTEENRLHRIRRCGAAAVQRAAAFPWLSALRCSAKKGEKWTIPEVSINLANSKFCGNLFDLFDSLPRRAKTPKDSAPFSARFLEWFIVRSTNPFSSWVIDCLCFPTSRTRPARWLKIGKIGDDMGRWFAAGRIAKNIIGFGENYPTKWRAESWHEITFH